MRGAALVVVAACAGCGENQSLVAAQHAAYDTDRGTVLREVAAVLDARYRDCPTTTDVAAGTVSTEWCLVRRESIVEGRIQRAAKGLYIRFDIAVVGPPWRVQVASYGGEMLPDARQMSPVDGAAGDADWIVSSTNRVIVDVHRGLERFAIALGTAR